MLRSITILLAIIASSRAVVAQCVTQLYSANAAPSIGLQAGGGWAANGKDAPPVSDAIGEWSTGCPEMGEGFPSLEESSTASITISVDFLTGRMDNVNEPDACAWFNAQLSNGQVVGGAIEIYQQSHNGRDCSWVLPHITLKKLIAHEVGHVLGLGNTPCSGYLMGPDWPFDGVNSEECGWIGELWTTPAEEAQASCDATCPVPCQGVPPSCPSGGGGGDCENNMECPPDSSSPLVLDLGGDGIPTSTPDAGVMFDIDGDGLLDRTGWTSAGADDGILYFDHNRNQRIDGGRELFGDATVLPTGGRSSHGFEALAWYDHPANGGNGDGVITPADAVWGKLRLWVDRDHDGIMANDENYSLRQRGVLEIDLAYVEIGADADFGRDAAGNEHRLRGTFELRAAAIGRPSVATRAVHDIWFRVARH